MKDRERNFTVERGNSRNAQTDSSALRAFGRKVKTSGTKEQLLKRSSLKRTTAEVLSRSAQESAIGQIQDTGHEGASRKESLRRATAEVQQGI